MEPKVAPENADVEAAQNMQKNFEDTPKTSPTENDEVAEKKPFTVPLKVKVLIIW